MRALLVVLALLVTGCTADAAGPEVVRVAAASNLQPALEALRAVVDVELQVTYGGSGTFVQQLDNGAGYDLFLSADVDYPRELVERGLARDADVFPYAVGRSVLWVPDGSALDPSDGLAALARPEVRRVAIANPRHAPYGRAAETALRAAGVYEQVEPKLLLGENVGQAADFLVSGGADAAIVPRSLVLSEPVRDVGRWRLLTQAPALPQAGVLLTDSAGARAVRDVLLGERGRRVLTAAGYDLPER